jgi:large subunit ribosomal protein L29
MKTAELNGLTDEELSHAEANALDDMFRMRFQHHTGQLNNTAQLAEMRKTVARIKTIRRSRALQASNGGSK